VDNNLLNMPVRFLKMVGPRRARQLEKLNIKTLGDLLYHFPRDYEDRREIKPAGQFSHGSNAVIKGTVTGMEDIQPRRKLTITKVGIHDGTGLFFAVWFNQPYIKKIVRPGTPLVVTGQMDKSFGVPQVKVSDFDIITDQKTLLNSTRIVPVYPLTEKLGQRTLRQVIYNALEEWGSQIKEFLPPYILKKYKLPAINKALRIIHFPTGLEQAREARKRFIFEELFLLQLALALRRSSNTIKRKVHIYSPGPGLVDRLARELPFSLTGAQERVWKEISADMDSTYPMQRLLQGDVGSGKTIICLFALLKAAESGLQGALMAPTEILAEQHFVSLQKNLRELGVKVALISRGVPAKEKSAIVEKISSGEIQIVVGTHAIIQETVRFNNLSLVVVDEQHRFGVRQRASLQYKGMTPDVLVMTATPIPRTLAMTLYGDLNISIIDEMPSGRLPVKTYAVKPSALHKVYKIVRREIAAGHQAYVVCALVEESKKIDVHPAVETAEHLQREIFPGNRVALLHGRMEPGEKEGIMSSFRRGEIDILVTTSVIEVGVDVPNATVMVIIDAHRFGLAQLHQLRGRVGRGANQSYCILVAEPGTVEAKKRLRAMTLTNDGFRLAEMDLQIRGPGEFFGTRQSGLPDLKVADLMTDIKTMQIAKNEASLLLARDNSDNEAMIKDLYKELKRRLNNKDSLLI